jgi:release factor family 3
MTTISRPADTPHVIWPPASDIFEEINATSMNIPAFTKQIAPRKTAASPPTVAVVMPFDPKMTLKPKLETAVKRIMETVEKALLANHSSEEAMPALKHLQQGLRGLNYSTHKQSVAVFASTDTARATYMDFPVDERIIIDTPFRVRDLADCKPAGKEYLLMLLSGTHSRMYRKAIDNGLQLIKSNTPQSIYAWLNEPPTRSGNFSDPDERHEVMLNKFMHHMDEGLDAVLKIYPLPVFVAGTDRITGHFASITRHQRNIAGYLHKHCMDCSETELEEMLRPQLDNWHQLRQQLLLLTMEKAAEAGKLVCGIDEVRKAARCSNSRVVIIERTPNAEGNDSPATFYTENILDQLVEKVLENGGVVEKLDPGLLGKYGPIALIRYY